MRVLDINNNYSPTGGGVRTYHERKRDWFRDRDEPYALVVPSDREERVVDGNVTTYHLPALALGRSGYRLIVRGRHVRRVLRDFAPDVIEIGSPYVLPRLVAKANVGAAATVGFYHADIPDTLVRPALARLGVAVAAQGTDRATRWIGKTYGAMTATFGASEFVLEKLADAGVTRLFRTPLGVDIDTHNPSKRSEAWRDELGVRPDQSLVLYLARVAPEKGIRRLFQAYPAFRDPERVALVVVGHGPLDGELSAFCARYPEVRRLGFIAEPTDVARAYASADVFVSLGALETFSLSTAEALSCGVATVSPSVGGASEQVRAVLPELVFDEDDPDDLARKVATALSWSVERRTALRAELHEIVRSRSSWDRVFEREYSYYERILGAQRSDQLDTLVAPSGRWHTDEDS